MFDTEKFIVEVEQRPPLYDVTSKEYSNKNIKAKCWLEVCEAMEVNWPNLSADVKDEKAKELMKKWKAIRDYFVREYKNENKFQTGAPASKRKKYFYYDQLSFLIPHVKGNQNNKTNIPLHDVEGLDEAADVGPMSVLDDNITQQSAADDAERRKRQNKTKGYRNDIAKAVASTTKSLTDTLKESINMRKEEMASDKYGNKAFLNSFVPMMDNFPPNVAAYARMKVAELFSKLSFEGIPSPPSNTSYPNISRSNSTHSLTSKSEHLSECDLQDLDDFKISTYIHLN